MTLLLLCDFLISNFHVCLAVSRACVAQYQQKDPDDARTTRRLDSLPTTPLLAAMHSCNCLYSNTCLNFERKIRRSLGQFSIFPSINQSLRCQSQRTNSGLFAASCTTHLRPSCWLSAADAHKHVLAITMPARSQEDDKSRCGGSECTLQYTRIGSSSSSYPVLSEMRPHCPKRKQIPQKRRTKLNSTKSRGSSRPFTLTMAPICGWERMFSSISIAPSSTHA